MPEDKCTATMGTVKVDPRFQGTNQSIHCYESYLDYHRCRKLKGGAYPGCDYFKRVYTTMCPNDWVKKWDEEIVNGNFAGKERIDNYC